MGKDYNKYYKDKDLCGACGACNWDTLDEYVDFCPYKAIKRRKNNDTTSKTTRNKKRR